jgi:hypothetical protein
MKKYLFSIFMIISAFCCYSQTGTYLVSIKRDLPPVTNGTSIYSIIVTDPTGTTTVQVLPDPIYDVVNHSTQLNQIYTNIYNQGYHLVPMTVMSNSSTEANQYVHVVSSQLFAPCCAP